MNPDEEVVQSNADPSEQSQPASTSDAAPQKAGGGLYCKVSPKGGVSVYGLQRMPVTLYVEQWHRLLGFGDELRQFLQEHDSELKRKEK